MKLCWIAASVTAANWALVTLLWSSYDQITYGITPPEIWAVYAGVALCVAALVGTSHPEVARAVAVVLIIATLLGPYFFGLWMLPSAVAAIALAIRAPQVAAPRF